MRNTMPYFCHSYFFFSLLCAFPCSFRLSWQQLWSWLCKSPGWISRLLEAHLHWWQSGGSHLSTAGGAGEFPWPPDRHLWPHRQVGWSHVSMPVISFFDSWLKTSSWKRASSCPFSIADIHFIRKNYIYIVNKNDKLQTIALSFDIFLTDTLSWIFLVWASKLLDSYRILLMLL